MRIMERKPCRDCGRLTFGETGDLADCECCGTWCCRSCRADVSSIGGRLDVDHRCRACLARSRLLTAKSECAADRDAVRQVLDCMNAHTHGILDCNGVRRFPLSVRATIHVRCRGDFERMERELFEVFAGMCGDEGYDVVSAEGSVDFVAPLPRMQVRLMRSVS